MPQFPQFSGHCLEMVPQDEKSGGACTWPAPPIPVFGNEIFKTHGRKKTGRDGSERRKLEALLA